ncbi:MAG TPA: hypothetical protein VN137_00375 [Sphingomonas sp.]|nr:hypothetical protein [Sphingomonas sp.]
MLPMALAASAAVTAPPKSACGVAGQNVVPVGNGPLVLAAIHCLELAHVSSGGASPPAPSADRKALFIFDVSSGLWLGETNSKAALRNVEADVTALNAFEYDQPFTWLDSGHSVLGVTQKKMKPRGGWALGPLKPFVASINGEVRTLPALVSPAGPLDEVHWVGNAGLAIVLFGAKGGYYRPEHRDPLPTIALVDAREGRIIQSLPLAELTPNPTANSINQVGWQVDRRGRVETLITLAPDRWVLWEQGKTPRRVPIDVKPWRTPYVLSPDGQSVLMMRGLSATGMICERNPKCPPPEPTSGLIAELRNIRSGKVIWSLTGTAPTFSNDGMPAISPNGRYALISMPTSYEGETAALIEMASGKILQKIPTSGAFRSKFGFSSDTKIAWISGYSRLAEYRIRE